MNSLRRAFAKATERARETRLACPICGGAARYEISDMAVRVARVVRHGLRPPLRILRCRACGHAFVRTMPGRETLRRWYGSFRYWMEDKGHQGITDMNRGDQWTDFLQARLNAMRRFALIPEPNSLAAPRVLEVGCSEGALLDAMGDLGLDPVGCEMNAEIAARARAYCRHPILVGDILEQDFGGRTFGLIVSFHTFEHLPDPVAAVERCASLLEPGGGLLLELPFGPAEYENLDHLHFFSEASARHLLGVFLTDVKLETNSYVTAGGVHAGSYYVCGRKTRT